MKKNGNHKNRKNNNNKKPLTYRQIIERLQDLPGWNYANNKISRELILPSFRAALKIVNDLADFCEENDHHPDIHIYYNKILFELQRFDIGGKVTPLDFMVAGEIERLYASQKVSE